MSLLRTDIVPMVTQHPTLSGIQSLVVTTPVEETQRSTISLTTLLLRHARVMIPNPAPEKQDPVTITNHLKFFQKVIPFLLMYWFPIFDMNNEIIVPLCKFIIFLQNRPRLLLQHQLKVHADSNV